MGNHARIRAPGTWTLGSDVDPSEFEALDDAQFDSVSATGGTYTLTEPLVFGGDPVIIDSGAEILVGGTAHIEDGGTFDMDAGSVGVVEADEFNFGGACTTEFGGGKVTFTGSCDPDIATGCTTTWQSGSTLATAAGSTTTLGGVSTINGVMTFASTCDPIVQSGCLWTFNSGSSVTMASGSSLVVNGTAQLAGTVTLNSVMTKTGNDGRIVHRVATLSSNADHDIDITKDIWVYSQTTTTTRTMTIRSTGNVPTTGETLRLKFFVNAGGTANIIVRTELAAEEIFTVTNTIGLGWTFAELYFDGTKWRCLNITFLEDAALLSVGGAF